jgi:hypothetical protein
LHNPDGLTDGSGFPYTFNTGTAGLFFNSSLNSSRVGEDVVLTNVIAFDIRVFDPAAPVSLSVDAAAVPGDPGFSSGSAAARGCYVDLGNGTVGVTSHFSSSAQGNYRLQAMGLAGSSIWDTWSSHYEANGVDEDGLARADQGTNGLDDTVGTYPQNGQVDEPGEQETSPPYPFPLRGLEVRLRVYEPTSRQVRQVTVRHTFVPH